MKEAMIRQTQVFLTQVTPASKNFKKLQKASKNFKKLHKKLQKNFTKIFKKLQKLQTTSKTSILNKCNKMVVLRKL